MSPRDLLAFALRALVGHRLRTALSLVGVAIGVAAVLVLTALGEGARAYVTAQFSNIGTNLVVIVPGRAETTGDMPVVAGVPNDLTLDDARAIVRGVPHVAAAAPLSSGTETVAHGERRRQVAVIGGTHDLRSIWTLEVAQGQFLPPGEMSRGEAVAVLGSNVARELFPGEVPIGRVVRVGAWRMRVIGVLVSRGMLLGFDMDEVVLIPVATCLRMFNRSSLLEIVLQARSHADVPAVRDDAVRLLTERHGEHDVTTLTEDAVNSTFGAILAALTVALAAIATISLSVAGIGIMNVMLVSVSERTREVGLLKALGARRRQILAVFVTEAILLSAAGGGIGMVFGAATILVLGWLFPELDARPPVWAVSAVLLLSLAVGAVFGVLPARRATRLDPAAALAGR